MRMGRGWAVSVAAIVVGGWLCGACGMDQSHKPFFHDEDEDTPGYSSNLADPLDEDSVVALLTPDEREAIEHAGMKLKDDRDPETSAPSERPQGMDGETRADKAGKLTLALLTVGITLGTMAAPFFMF